MRWQRCTFAVCNAYRIEIGSHRTTMIVLHSNHDNVFSCLDVCDVTSFSSKPWIPWTVSRTEYNWRAVSYIQQIYLVGWAFVEYHGPTHLYRWRACTMPFTLASFQLWTIEGWNTWPIDYCCASFRTLTFCGAWGFNLICKLKILFPPRSRQTRHNLHLASADLLSSCLAVLIKFKFKHLVIEFHHYTSK